MIIFLLLITSVALIIGMILLNKRLQRSEQKQKNLQQRLQEQQNYVDQINQKYGGLISREDSIRALDAEILRLTQRSEQVRAGARTQEHELKSQLESLTDKLSELQEQDFIESFGFYESKYDFQDAEAYKKRLNEIRDRQKQMIKSKTAAICHTQWTVGGSAKDGQKMTDSFIRLVLRAFNGECDSAIMKVKYNNIQTMENRIRKTREELNKLSQVTHCEVTEDFLDLKLQELWLTHEYQERKYQEQEEQKMIRDQMREEEKALKELEKAKQEAEKEEKRYQEALDKARREVESAKGKTQEKLLSQIEELQQRLQEAEANKQRAISQAQKTKSGHVYIISNIGSFGDNVYKIGMTRRLEPMERVKELGDASVPFPFDVHAMIFCEDAPGLESLLHKRFAHLRVNKINERKEFFRVSLSEIVDAVQQMDKELQVDPLEITFTKIAEASEFRKTLAKERDIQGEATVAS